MSLQHNLITKTLANGLTILGIPVPGTEAVTVIVTIRSGARNESDTQQGLAHFAEHMFFKGGKKYTSTKVISEALDGVGGEFNAFTSHELTSFYTKTAPEHVSLGLDILSDMLLYPQFPADELEKEKGVIVEEINLYNDMPMRLVDGVIQNLLFGDTPLGRPILGTKESVTSFSADDFHVYHQSRYVGARSVVVLAGAVTEDMITQAAAHFEEMPAGEHYLPVAADVVPRDTKVALTVRESEQTHLVLTFPGVPVGHPDYAALLVLSTLLGGTMSSRLFAKVREAQGLCYYVRSGVDSYQDVGVVAISAGVDNKRLQNAIEAIVHELSLVQGGDVREEEVARAIQNRVGRTKLAMEDSEQVALFYSEQFTIEAKTDTPAERLAAIEAVTLADVNRVAKAYIRPDEYRLATVGPEGDMVQVRAWLSYKSH